MAISDDTLRKIINMIGVLGSDIDGEIIAAARGIRRLLDTEKATFGDLKSRLTAKPGAAPAPRPRVHPTLDAAEELESMTGYMPDMTGYLPDHAARFVKQMAARMRADPNFEMTERQGNWFWSLYGKHCGG